MTSNVVHPDLVWAASSTGIGHAFTYHTRELRLKMKAATRHRLPEPVDGPVGISHCGKIPGKVGGRWGGKIRRKCIVCSYLLKTSQCRRKGGTGKGALWDPATIQCEVKKTQRR